VDGDEDDVEVFRDGVGDLGPALDLGGLWHRGVAPDAVLIDPVVGDIDGAGVNLAVEVIAVATREPPAESITVEVAKGLKEPGDGGAEASVGGGSLDDTFAVPGDEGGDEEGDDNRRCDARSEVPAQSARPEHGEPDGQDAEQAHHPEEGEIHDLEG